jgi:hypothetical protein
MWFAMDGARNPCTGISTVTDIIGREFCKANTGGRSGVRLGSVVSASRFIGNAYGWCAF